MSLSCSCGDILDMEPGVTYWSEPGFETMPWLKRRKRCENCKALIEPGEDCVKFDQVRLPKNEIEERIHHEIVMLAPIWICEKCGEIWGSLADYGYCVSPFEVTDCLKAYWVLTEFDPEKYKETE